METSKTKKLYDLDAYRVQFDAVVVSCVEMHQKDCDVYQVVLDETLFFPEEGGQSPDTGTVDGIRVIDVQIQGDVITHTLEQPVAEGATVHGSIDWKHRFYNMQQHSGEHIFSGIVHRRFGFNNVGFHLSDNIVTMDFNGLLSEADVAEVEYEANEVIVSNLPVEVTYPSNGELAVLDYRSKIEIKGQVRIVTIPGVDVCACCAPHVKRTGEIGMLKVMNLSNYKGGVRISILCGFRALAAYREKSDILRAIGGTLSASQELLPGLVEKLKGANQDLSYQLSKAKQELMTFKIQGISPEQENVILFESGIETPVMRSVVNDLTATHKGVCGVFSGTEEEGYQFIIGSAESDCRKIVSLLREKAGARGGGSEAMVQGSVQAKAQVLTDLLNHFETKGRSV